MEEVYLFTLYYYSLVVTGFCCSLVVLVVTLVVPVSSLHLSSFVLAISLSLDPLVDTPQTCTFYINIVIFLLY